MLFFMHQNIACSKLCVATQLNDLLKETSHFIDLIRCNNIICNLFTLKQ